MKSSVMSTAL